MRNALLGAAANIDGDEGEDTPRNPPWVQVCLRVKCETEDVLESREYMVFGTKLRAQRLAYMYNLCTQEEKICVYTTHVTDFASNMYIFQKDLYPLPLPIFLDDGLLKKILTGNSKEEKSNSN